MIKHIKKENMNELMQQVSLVPMNYRVYIAYTLILHVGPKRFFCSIPEPEKSLYLTSIS